MIATLPTLPVPNLKTDEKFLPTIITDSREQSPLVFQNLPSIVAGLTTGDYSVLGLEDDFCVERKTLPDLYGSLTSGRDRFMRELQRMNAYPFRRLLIIGSEREIEMGSSRARGVNPKAILHSLHAIEARRVPVVYAPSSTAAANLVERWAFWRAREVLKTASEMMRSHDPEN
jgi:ERCC4-type nuclease